MNTIKSRSDWSGGLWGEMSGVRGDHKTKKADMNQDLTWHASKGGCWLVGRDRYKGGLTDGKKQAVKSGHRWGKQERRRKLAKPNGKS